MQIQQLFAPQRPIVLRQPRTGNLQAFMETDTGNAIFKGVFRLRGPYVLPLYLIAANGQKMKPICLPRPIVAENRCQVYGAAQEEKNLKVLYTWKEAADWGVPARLFTKHILARKVDGKWEILPKAEIVAGQTKAGLIKAEAKNVTELINRPEINQPATFWQKTTRHRGADCLKVNVNGRTHFLFGFNGESEVMAVTVKLRGGEIRLSVYSQAGLLRQFIFPPDPAAKARVSYSNSEAGIQRRRLLASQLHNFLLADSAAAFDLEPKAVNQAGSFNLYVGGRLNGGYIPLSGFREYSGEKLSGRVIVNGLEKRAYFWPDEAARAAGDKPILPEGQIVAKWTGVNGSGRWEIVWRTKPDRWDKAVRTEKYGNFLFSRKTEGRHEELVPLHFLPNGRVRFERTPRRHLIGTELGTGIASPILAVTQKLGRPDLHLLELRENGTGKLIAAFWLAVKQPPRGNEVKLFELVEFSELCQFLRLRFDQRAAVASHQAVHPYRPLLAKYF